MKYISMKEYKPSEEYAGLLNDINTYLDNKKEQCHVKGFDFYTFRQPLNGEYIMDKYDIPFFDRATKFYYHRDGKLILNLDIYYYQLEFFMKALFIRIYWCIERPNDDQFAPFIWEEFCNSNDDIFNNLKNVALTIFNDCSTVREFYNKFILNDEYTFIKYDDYMDAITAALSSFGYTFIQHNLVEFPDDSIEIFEDAQATKFTRALRTDNIDLRQIKLIGAFNKLATSTKYRFVPSTKAHALKHFNFSLVINDGVFFPQLLLFPK